MGLPPRLSFRIYSRNQRISLISSSYITWVIFYNISLYFPHSLLFKTINKYCNKPILSISNIKIIAGLRNRGKSNTASSNNSLCI
jgi:predicted transporter